MDRPAAFDGLNMANKRYSEPVRYRQLADAIPKWLIGDAVTDLVASQMEAFRVSDGTQGITVGSDVAPDDESEVEGPLRKAVNSGIDLS